MDEPIPQRRAEDIKPDDPLWAKVVVANARYIWREFSTWFISVIAFLAAAAEVMPLWVPQAKDYVSGPVRHYAVGICALAGRISKFIRQKPPVPASQPTERKDPT